MVVLKKIYIRNEPIGDVPGAVNVFKFVMVKISVDGLPQQRDEQKEDQGKKYSLVVAIHSYPERRCVLIPIYVFRPK